MQKFSLENVDGNGLPISIAIVSLVQRLRLYYSQGARREGQLCSTQDNNLVYSISDVSQANLTRLPKNPPWAKTLACPPQERCNTSERVLAANFDRPRYKLSGERSCMTDETIPHLNSSSVMPSKRGICEYTFFKRGIH